MVWEVEYTDEFEAWWNTLSEDEQAEVNSKVELLEEHGPTLSRPYADVITTSRHSNMSCAGSLDRDIFEFCLRLTRGARPCY
jgi:hypothetical protein